MGNPEQAVQRGEEAQRLLQSPMFEQAFADTRTAYLEALASLPDIDSKEARALHLSVKLLDKVQRCITEHVTTGKLAQKTVESIAKRPNLLSRLR